MLFLRHRSSRVIPTTSGDILGFRTHTIKIGKNFAGNSAFSQTDRHPDGQNVYQNKNLKILNFYSNNFMENFENASLHEERSGKVLRPRCRDLRMSGASENFESSSSLLF